MISKIVLVLGPGQGADFVYDLLEKHYTANETPFLSFIIGSRYQYSLVLEEIEGFNGYVLIKTNLFVRPGEWSEWQRILVTG
ncbi:MAG: hypothetical protein MI892_24685 [Desulfobacterales bacterium]|nr:hypothetical protein [Desulfobacterales bacterium]